MRKESPDQHFDKLHEIETMRREALDMELTYPAFDTPIPPALESLKRTVVWVPYQNRGALVQGLPRSQQDTLLTDIKDPRHSVLATIFIAAMQVDALLYLRASQRFTEQTLSQMDTGLFYKLWFENGVIESDRCPEYLPSFHFNPEMFKEYFLSGPDEFPINAYLWKRWVESAK